MKTLKQIIQEAEKNKVAIGHFNISECAGLKGIFKAAQELNLPVIIGVSEGEAGFIGYRQVAGLVKSLREEYNYPIFLNLDHAKSLEKIKEAVEAGFDAVMFDGGGLSFEENIKKTKEVVEYVKNFSASRQTEILVEAEIGYLKGSSTLLAETIIIKEEDLTKTEEAAQFVKETGVDLLAPSVGNIHGMFKNAPNPNLNIERIKEIKNVAGIPLVLHGGSGIIDDDFLKAIDAGISIIHINTELRLAWRKGMDKALKENPEEIVPYKLLPIVIEEIRKAAYNRLKLFNKL
ncbi:MAG: class II fructose-bisphosphate aldolase [bacterium]|nr:class II fructose-bisphosphate aldolase [bacterium]